jgi:hypothetical protein
MAIRLIVTITAAPGRGAELAQLYKAQVNSTRPSLPSELRTGTTEREDYEYNRTR